jgi:hypothetical protein
LLHAPVCLLLLLLLLLLRGRRIASLVLPDFF